MGEKARDTNNTFAQKTPHMIVKKKLVNNPIHLNDEKNQRIIYTIM